MKLSIIDTEKRVDYDISWVELNTPAGNLVIQKGHAPMIIELSLGQELIFELSSGRKESLDILQAVAHVTKEEVKILIPAAV